MEKFPKKTIEETDDDSHDELPREELEAIATEVEKMSPEDMVAYAKGEIVHSQEKIELRKERIAHLKAQIERLNERLQPMEGAEREFLQKQLDEKQMHLQEYLEDVKEEEEDITEAGDIVDGMEEQGNKHLN